jgi:multidrug efflux pump subunit AcrA (membrane-fusion protein)
VEKLMSPQEADDAEAELKLAEAELQTARENRQLAATEFQQQSSLLNLRTLRSPFDGVVVDQLMYPGEVVESTGAKKAILKLAQLDPLRVHVILPMAAFRKVAPGMSVQVALEAPIGGAYPAKVKTVDKLIDAASGSFAVFLEMRNSDLAVPAGVKCRVEFPLATENQTTR